MHLNFSSKWVQSSRDDLQWVQNKISFCCPRHLNNTIILINPVPYTYTSVGVGQRSSTGLSKWYWFTPNKHLTWKSKEQMYNQAILFPAMWFLLPLNKSDKKSTKKAYLFYLSVIILPGNCKHPVLSLTRINLCFGKYWWFPSCSSLIKAVWLWYCLKQS